MAVPLSLAVPAAAAGLAYLNAKHSLFYDALLISSKLRAEFAVKSREKSGQLNVFYILEQHAKDKKTSQRDCLIFEGRSWTYKEVYDTALKYGTWLKQTHAFKSKEIVAMDFMNSEQFIFVWFGLWAIGAVPAFINYNLTGKALSHCISVSTSRIVFVDPAVGHNVTQDVRDELASVEFVTFTPGMATAALATTPIRQPDSDRLCNNAADVAILVYTSGTTGLPKPAIVSWRKVVMSGAHFTTWMGYKPSDIFYTSMPLYHSSASMLGMSNTIFIGGTLSLGRKFSTKTFWSEVRDSKATIIQYVGETCRYLLAAPPSPLDKDHNVRIAFGNGLRPDIWNRFKERFNIPCIAEFYAATEGTSGTFNFSRNDFGAGAIGRHGSIGRAMLGRNVILVKLDWETEAPWRDPKTGLCKQNSDGSAGELLNRLDPANISASFQGYFNNKKATESKVMRDVLVKGDAWYRTGDVVSWNDDGMTYFSDRIGDTFRWKSENVSTNEVSEALGSHPAIVEANVYGVEVPHHDGRAGCVALVLKDKKGSADQAMMDSLTEHARKNLPKYAWPVFVRVTRDMEITGTNKQQKHVLRAQGVDLEKIGKAGKEGMPDEMWWLQGGRYVPFGPEQWRSLRGGKVKL